ncbi:SGNH/GDSL hydrolase family protein [Robertkochia flava]|uniref:SGNH/GDSL hydrolase family protein n=1 Tax=Robertkochia flava TaxID=3447986 RepID=UPI001CCA8018|nr:SGNH/GDSL hydrolase family protein [Robertkochia marina]
MKHLYLLFVMTLLMVSGCRQTSEKEPQPQETEQKESTPEQKTESTEPGMAVDTNEEERELTPKDTVYSRYGRTAILEDGSTELISPASHVRFRAMGDTTVVRLETAGEAHGYALVTLNETFSWKFRLPGSGISEIPIPMGNKDAWHELAVYKLTEAHNGGVIFHGAQAESLKTTGIAPELHIEFIGNSITCGYGADATEIPCGEGVSYDQHNPYEAYAARVARELRAGYNLSAVSGIGIYRNYREDRKETMPEIYGYLYLDDGRQATWDPDGWNPDIVSICLGTNDFSRGSDPENRAAFDPEQFTNAYIKFVEDLNLRYPEAAFALLNSPMVTGENTAVLEEALSKVQSHFSDTEIIEVFKFEDVGLAGCATHPGLEDHELMADQIRPFYINLLDKVAERDGLLVE